jgi:acetolactate synthase small subunit
MTNTLFVMARQQNILLRIIGLLCRFGIKLSSMTVNENKESKMYTIIFTVICEDKKAEEIKKQIKKQVDVISVQ